MTLLQQTDYALALYVNQLAGRSIALDKLVYDIADTSLMSGGVLLASYWWLWFEADEKGEYAQRRNIIVAFVAIAVVAGVVWLLQALLPFRHHPLDTAGLGLRLPFGVDPAALGGFNSFPSGHAALFFALCVPLWKRSRRLGAAAGLWTLVAICLPLTYLGYHWPSDIIAGAAIGIVLMLLACTIIGAAALPDRLVRFSATRAPAFYAIGWLLAFEIAVLFGDVRAFFQDLARLAGMLLF